ncbi:hypothetical protein AGR56_08835 [Clostridium sp. DMHC 10]|uniref:ABC transporter permease n=1 Tax=Clostridium sp. DMHC 10 TaxID=747377 RepID=UPI00069E308C|nr:ABC transporter permease [Clostridium sp. DMHC 10]KOF56770.1 hypothetical protein AGR56_08835 [Clostridium sp. DMHC 10]
MYNLIKADLFKLRKSMAIKILLGITTVSSIAMIMMAYLLQQGKLSASASGLGFMFSDANMISILGAGVASIIICGDFDNRTIHEAIVNGNSRVKVVISKSITFCCGLFIILLPYIIVTAIAISTGYKYNMGQVSVGFLNIITLEAGKAISTSQVWKLLIIMLALAILYAAQLSICIPFAISFKKPVVVVPVYYGIVLFCTQLSRLEKTSKVFKNIYELTPYEGKYSLMSLSAGTNDIIKAIAVSLAFMIIMLTITCFVFRKAEIK